MKTTGVWVDLTKRVHLGSGQVRGSGSMGQMSLWDAVGSHDMKAVSEALDELGFFDKKKETLLSILDAKITSTPNAGLIDDEILKVEIKVQPGTKIGYDPR